MACFFSSIRNFSSNLVIQGQLATYVSNNKVESTHQISGKAQISCISLQKWQKLAAISVCALAIIVFAAGIVISNGAGLSTYAMICGGLTVALLTIGYMSVNHILFLKKVNNLLECESVNNWNNAIKYPPSDADFVMEGQSISSDIKGEFSFQNNGSTIYGRRYSESGDSGSIRFYIEFYRTRAIFDQKT